MWLGQSFACCDSCGLPFWEHTHDARLIRGRPINVFDPDSCYEHVLITEEQKRAAEAIHGEGAR